MGNACRICHARNRKMITLCKESSSSIELQIEGEEFEYCFGLEVLEVPEYTEICIQCQQQLHSFYLFKQQAIKSHYELLNKMTSSNKTKKNIKREETEKDRLDISKKNIEDNTATNSKFVCHKDLIKSENDEVIDNNLQEIAEISVGTFPDENRTNASTFVTNMTSDDINDSSGDNISNEGISETIEDLKVESSKSRQKSDKRKRGVPRRKCNFKCEICNKKLINEESYQAHMNKHKGLPPYSCESCGKGFKEKMHLIYHTKKHNNQRDFVCEICSKGFFSKVNLQTHMKCHNNEKQYVCDQCGKSFRKLFNMKEHKETHSEEKVECQICHSKLSTKSTLKSHMRGVHGLYNNPKIFCTICQKQFIKKKYYTTHMAKKHPENEVNQV